MKTTFGFDERFQKVSKWTFNNEGTTTIEREEHENKTTLNAFALGNFNDRVGLSDYQTYFREVQ